MRNYDISLVKKIVNQPLQVSFNQVIDTVVVLNPQHNAIDLVKIVAQSEQGFLHYFDMEIKSGSFTYE